MFIESLMIDSTQDIWLINVRNKKIASSPNVSCRNNHESLLEGLI